MATTINPGVDEYLSIGCGRCKLVGTPDCKVKKWPLELETLRQFLLDSELEEEVKWSMPCYTIDGKNVLILAAFKDYVSLNFFKGSLIKDQKNLLEFAGENSHVAKQFRFTSVKEIETQTAQIIDFIQQAIAIEKAGLKVPENPKKQLEYPEELNAIMAEIPGLQSAFEKLTPGRQRGYLLHFTSAKQSATRTNRIEKYVGKILEGKGMMD